MDIETLDRGDLRGLTEPELRSVLRQLDEQLRHLHQDPDGRLRELDTDQQARFDRLLIVRDEAQARLDQHARIRSVFDRGGATETAFGRFGDHGLAFTRDASEVLRMAGDELRSQALRSLELAGRDLDPAAADRLDGLIRSVLSREQPNLDGEYIAARMLITESDAYRSAFRRVMSSDHPILTEQEVRALRAFETLEARALGEWAAPGSYGVPTLIDPTILLSSGADAAPVMQAARVVQVTTNHWKGVSSAPPVFTFQTEGAAVSDASPAMAQPEIYVHMARSFIPYSFEVEQDWPDFAGQMALLLAQGWDDMIAAKTITGSGSGEPFGILTKLDATTTSEVRVTTAGTLDAQQIFRVWNALPERFRRRSSWIMSVSVESAIRSFGATPNPSSYFTVDLTAEGITRLNGRPNLVTDYMPAYSTATSTVNYCVVGDIMSAYTVALRAGLNVERVGHLFQQVTAGSGPAVPTGQRGVLAWGRVGADLVVPSAARLLNQT